MLKFLIPQEIANNILVAHRQKHKGMAWSADGSFACSGITMILKNGEGEGFFNRRELRFSPRDKAGAHGHMTGIEFIFEESATVKIDVNVTTWIDELFEQAS